MNLQVKGAGVSWAVYHGDQRVSGHHTSRDNAMTVKERTERRSRQIIRACLCCQQSFISDGAHNRMCNDCRRLDMGLG